MAYGMPAQLLVAVSANPGTVPFLDNGECLANHSIQVTAGVGVTAGSVQLQGSLDGVSWFNLGTAVATTAPGTSGANAAGFPARYVRANIATPITGGTVTVSVGSA